MTRPLRVGIAGLGTVGASVIRILDRQNEAVAKRGGRPVEIVAVSARDRSKDRGFDLASFAWFDSPVELARSAEVDCVVELVGGADGAALDTVRTALSLGKHVVTANKALLAKHGLELARFAEEKGVSLAFEASVAGGIPIIKAADPQRLEHGGGRLLQIAEARPREVLEHDHQRLGPRAQDGHLQQRAVLERQPRRQRRARHLEPLAAVRKVVRGAPEAHLDREALARDAGHGDRPRRADAQVGMRLHPGVEVEGGGRQARHQARTAGS